MDRAVVVGFAPGRAVPISLSQFRYIVAADGVWLAGDLDQKLVAHGPKKPLYLAPSFRSVWCRMDQAHSKFRACSQQPLIDERRAAVDVDRLGDTAAGQRRPQRACQ